jgi:flagellar basal-body rod protein FlgB
MAPMLVTRTDVVVRGALDGLATRHRVYANNLANLETPGFTPSDVPFEAQLRQARDRMAFDPRRIVDTPPLRLRPVITTQAAGRADANDVEIDEQVMQLAENSLTYEAVAQSARLRNELMRDVIADGKR